VKNRRSNREKMTESSLIHLLTTSAASTSTRKWTLWIS